MEYLEYCLPSQTLGLEVPGTFLFSHPVTHRGQGHRHWTALNFWGGCVACRVSAAWKCVLVLPPWTRLLTLLSCLPSLASRAGSLQVVLEAGACKWAPWAPAAIQTPSCCNHLLPLRIARTRTRFLCLPVPLGVVTTLCSRGNDLILGSVGFLRWHSEFWVPLHGSHTVVLPAS